MGPFFLFGCVVLLVFLIAPGYLLTRHLCRGTALAVSVAPPVSMGFYVILGVLFSFMGIRGSGYLLFFGALVPSVAVFAALELRKRHHGTSSQGTAQPTAQKCPCDRLGGMPMLLVFVGIGAVVAAYAWLSLMDGVTAFSRTIDNSTHMSMVRTMVTTGSYSTLNVATYVGGAVGFYPAAWHIVTAMMADVCKLDIPVAENASLFVFSALVYQAGWYALLSTLVSNKRIVLAGSFAASAFAAFPWRLLTWGLLVSNLAAYALMPAAATVFILLSSDGASMRRRVGCFVTLCFSGVAVVAAQPNAFFSLVVMLTPYCVYRVVQVVSAAKAPLVANHRALIKVVAGLAVILVVIAGWAYAYNMPFMQGILTAHWDASMPSIQVLPSVLALAFKDSSGQYVLGAFVFVGVLYTIYRRRYLWMTISYVIAIFIHGVGVSTEGQLKSYLTGFWYTDTFRTAALCAIVAVPLAAMGVYVAWKVVRALVARIARSCEACFPKRAYVAIAAICALVAVFYPNYTLPGLYSVKTGFGQLRNLARNSYDMVNIHFDAELNRDMIDFAKRAQEVVGDGTVLNLPYDGSSYLYGAIGLNTYFHSMLSTAYGPGSGEDDTHALVRTYANELGTNTQIAEALDQAGVKYVLLFDITNSHPENYKWTYDSNQWTGLTAISDSTPGLEVVLSEGNMRLYRIVS